LEHNYAIFFHPKKSQVNRNVICLKDVSKSTLQIWLLHAAGMLRQFNENFPLEFSWCRWHVWPPIKLKEAGRPSAFVFPFIGIAALYAWLEGEASWIGVRVA